MDEVFEVEFFMRLGLLLGFFDVPVPGCCFEVVGSDGRLSCGSIGGLSFRALHKTGPLG